VKARQSEIADKYLNIIGAERISDPGDLRSALSEALLSRRPRIIEAMVNPDAHPPLSLYDVKREELNMLRSGRHGVSLAGCSQFPSPRAEESGCDQKETAFDPETFEQSSNIPNRWSSWALRRQRRRTSLSASTAARCRSLSVTPMALSAAFSGTPMAGSNFSRSGPRYFQRGHISKENCVGSSPANSRGFSFLPAHPGHPRHGSWGRDWSQSRTARQRRRGTSVTPRGLIHV
jgi:hypothetical protein